MTVSPLKTKFFILARLNANSSMPVTEEGIITFSPWLKRNIECGTRVSPSGSSIVPKVVFLNISLSFFNEVKYRSSAKPFIVRF